MVNFPVPRETTSWSGLAAVEALVWPRNGVGLTMVAAISVLVNLIVTWSSAEVWILSDMKVCYVVGEVKMW